MKEIPLSDAARKLRSAAFNRIITPDATALDHQKYKRVAHLGLRPEPMSKEAWLFWQQVRKAAGRQKYENRLLDLETAAAENYP